MSIPNARDATCGRTFAPAAFARWTSSNHRRQSCGSCSLTIARNVIGMRYCVPSRVIHSISASIECH
jgi:hypothetical protein